ncbi:MAG: hypothetical protein LBH75_05760 [Treponema sp.]|jgi:hypothetical protein|nr:hypothetical protein [Treponema sp.]
MKRYLLPFIAVVLIAGGCNSSGGTENGGDEEQVAQVESIQVNFNDSGDQQAMGMGQKVKPQTEIGSGWNILYYKLVGTDSPEREKYADTGTAELLSVDADGTKLEESAQGAYSSDTFDVNDIKEIEIRLLDGINDDSENKGQNIGKTVVAYIDEIGWYTPGDEEHTTVIDFETDLGEAQCIYNNDDESNQYSRTVPPPNVGTSGVSDGNEGERTLKITGELQPDRYEPYATEAALTLKIADFLEVDTLDLVDKVFYIKVRVPDVSVSE